MTLQGTAYARSMDLRYFGEGQEMEVPLTGSRITEKSLRHAIEDFHQQYLALFRHGYRNETPVEIVNLRLSGIGSLGRPNLKKVAQSGPSPVDAYKSARLIYFKETGLLECRTYHRDKLLAGNFIDGPSVVEDYGSTTVILPEQSARVDPFGNLVITPKPSGK